MLVYRFSWKKNKGITLVFFLTPRAMAILALALYPPLGGMVSEGNIPLRCGTSLP
jgi:hypothetical protein